MDSRLLRAIGTPTIQQQASELVDRALRALEDLKQLDESLYERFVATRNSEAIRFMGSLLPGGWDELRSRNHALALRGRSLLCEALDIEAPAPEIMIGSLATVPLPPAPGAADAPPLSTDPILNALWERHWIGVLASVWPESPRRILRVAAQIYNHESQYATLAGALLELLAAGA